MKLNGEQILAGTLLAFLTISGRETFNWKLNRGGKCSPECLPQTAHVFLLQGRIKQFVEYCVFSQHVRALARSAS